MRPDSTRSRLAVVALGGNALAPAGERASIRNQFRHARQSVAPIVELARQGWQLVVVHGNGPQVGDELVRNEIARTVVEPLPLGVMVASTVGWLGYMLQQSLHNALAQAGLDRPVLTVLTQTLVAADDPDLARPTKPIGVGLTASHADLLKEMSVAVGMDADGRWRRLAPSPKPIGIVEADCVARLARDGVIVIAGGGGGPPVVQEEGALNGREAVVDKDRVAALLAGQLGAEALVILTDVDAVYRGWGTDDARPISHLTLAEADAMLARGLDEGGMGPKLAAAASFVRHGGARAVIAHLEQGALALAGQAGTAITADRSEVLDN